MPSSIMLWLGKVELFIDYYLELMNVCPDSNTEKSLWMGGEA